MVEENTAPASVAVDDATAAKAPEAKKRNAAKRQKAAAEPVRLSNATAAKATGGKTRKHSAEEKLKKLKSIEAQVADGASTLKDAIKSAGMSAQTYYNWKGSVRSGSQTAAELVPTGDEFAELVQLEAENQRLRRLLCEKLRAENSDLRKRLGQD
ncbi:transcriptional regulator [Ensifer sp. NM-2]|uniref:transposase n=1 Tax=Ensifer sp. NM-2 TaxID=2109730 RepID=UPI000D124C58|nr:transposase [Ensifer sp. NM-2]PSS59987.1 transcriptional regulator [Ensifer sp. NM-2]